MKQILFNGTHAAELRIAVVQDGIISDLILEAANRAQKKANIYKAKITRVEPSLEAAFVDFGQERHGFLPLKEVASQYFQNKSKNADDTSSIKDSLKEGQEILIQVEKEERGNKGAALSSYISLAGSYLVLMPNSPKAGGISRRIEGEDRDQLKENLSHLEIPKGMGVIIRTAGVGRSVEELQWDLQYLITLWDNISKAAGEHKSPKLIHQESDACTRALRDYFRDDVAEIIIDDEELYETIREQISIFHPEFIKHVKLYKNKQPLFTKFGLETQIQAAFQREVRLTSGGSIVIDRTEALIAIDINSAQATHGGDIEETALQTNLEAADEIARQLRLRDLGGLIVIDFIDMTASRNQRDVENRLNQALTNDRARVQTGRISRFGLLELSRQRLRSSIGEVTQHACPRCHGRGSVRSVESLALTILRLIEQEAAKADTGQVYAQVPVAVATYLLNESRANIGEIEQRRNVNIFIIPNANMETPEFEIERIKGSKCKEKIIANSYELTTGPKNEATPRFGSNENALGEQPAVKGLAPATPAPSVEKSSQSRKKASLLGRIVSSIFGEAEQKEPTPTQTRQPQNRRPNQRRSSGGQRSGQRTGQSSGRRPQGQGQQRPTTDSKGQGQGQDNRRRRPDSRRPASEQDQRPTQVEKPAQPKTTEQAATAQQSSQASTDKPQRESTDSRRSQQNRRTRGGNNQNRQRGPRSNDDNRGNKATTAPRKPTVKQEASSVLYDSSSSPKAQAKPATPRPTRPKSAPTENPGFKQMETTGEPRQAAPITEKPRGQKRPAPKKIASDSSKMKMVETDK